MALNKVQKTYIEAKTNYLAANSIAAEYMEQWDWMLDSGNDTLIKLYAEISTNKDNQLGVSDLWDAYKAAENALIEWAKAIAMKLASNSEQSELATLFVTAEKSTVYRHKIIDLAVRLAA